MNKEQALVLLQSNLQNKNLIKHSLAVGAVMKGLAQNFEQDQETWEVCGLLHDIDYEKSHGDPLVHSQLGSKMLEEAGLPIEIAQAVLTHNEAHGLKPVGMMAKALYCCDPLTGLIIAAALVLPSKKLADVKTENVLNRFPEKSFAKGANREIISQCQELLDLSLRRFVEITLSSMQDIAEELGL